MAKGNNARDKIVKENQKELVCKYRAQSFSFREIAEKVSSETGVKITHVTAYNDYTEALKEAKKQVEDMAVFSLIEQLEKLDRLEHQYWVAWERSLGKTTKKKIKKRGQNSSDEQNLSEIEAEETQLNGDVSFLNGIKACIELRCKIAGNMSPVKVDVTTGGERFETKGFQFLPYTPLENK